MEELIEDLKQHAQQSLFPSSLPSEDDLIAVEEQIFLPMPSEYKSFLLQAGNLVLGKMELSSASDSGAHNYIPEMTATAWASGLPRDVFPVCSAQGNYYCMTPTGHIKYWINGDYDEEKEWEDIWDWAEKEWLQAAKS